MNIYIEWSYPQYISSCLCLYICLVANALIHHKVIDQLNYIKGIICYISCKRRDSVNDRRKSMYTSNIIGLLPPHWVLDNIQNISM